MKSFGPKLPGLTATRLSLASLAALLVVTTAAQADPRWRHRFVQPWNEEIFYEEDASDEDVVYYENDDDEEVIFLNRRARARAVEEEVDNEIWWLEENARKKFEARAKARKAPVKQAKPVKKLAVKKKEAPAKVAVKAKPAPLALVPPVAKVPLKLVADAKADTIQTASLTKPVLKPAPKAKAVSPAIKVSLPKPAAKPAPKAAVNGKTIGCTAGAAVITGYGFGDVKPKACTGTAYAYTAARAGKLYHITLTAASGEITDVKKLN